MTPGDEAPAAGTPRPLVRRGALASRAGGEWAGVHGRLGSAGGRAGGRRLPVLPSLTGGGRSDWRELVRDLAGSARRAGRGAVVSGRWLAETVVELAPRVPVRDPATLSAHHDGLTGEALARAVVRSAGRVSAGIAAATGGLVAAQQVSVAALVAVPFELAAETALVVLVELKLVAELHQLAGRPLTGGPVRRSRAALTVWVSGHPVPRDAEPRASIPPGAGPEGDSSAMSPAFRRQLAAALRRRFRHNLATLGPLLTGAAAAGYLNRRATVSIGNRVARELGLRR